MTNIDLHSLEYRISIGFDTRGCMHSHEYIDSDNVRRHKTSENACTAQHAYSYSDVERKLVSGL